MKIQLKKRLVIFVIFALACGWFVKIADVLLVNQPEGQSLGSLLWLITPFAAAVFLARVNKSAWKRLGILPGIKGNVKWYLISFLVFPVTSLIMTGIGIGIGAIDTSKFILSKFSLAIATFFIYNFFRVILEETAWRGFLQERLMKLSVNDWVVYIITALVWSTWHIPYYMYFYQGDAAGKMIFTCFILIFSWSILFSEIYSVTRSIWPCVLLHAATNAIQFAMLEDYLVLDKGAAVFISPTLSIAACILYIGTGLLIRKWRKAR